ncbi:hypothetical protein WA158_005340 [Blastocystis sp. Blastoise]
MTNALEPKEFLYWRDEQLYDSIVLIFAHHLKFIKEDEVKKGIYTLFGKKINKVELCGIIVSDIQKEDYHLITIDDGTGLAKCTLWNRLYEQCFETNDDSICQLVKLCGTIKNIPFGGVYAASSDSCLSSIRVTISNMKIVNDCNEEMVQWLKVIKAHKLNFNKNNS